MALTLTPSPFQQVLVDGEPQSGAKIYTYVAGTTTNQATYTTSAGDVANANPIVADAQGRYVAYLSAGASYKFKITTSADVAIDTQRQSGRPRHRWRSGHGRTSRVYLGRVWVKNGWKLVPS